MLGAAPGMSLGLVRPGPGPIYVAAALPGAPPIAPERILRGGQPILGEATLFRGAGAPIALLGLVWSGGLPLSGPVAQIYRAGGAPVFPTTPAATLTPSGPIGAFFLGTTGAPIGVPVFRGGGLPIGPGPAVARAIAAEQFRTAYVTAPAIGLPGLFGITAVAPAPGLGLGAAGASIAPGGL